MQMVLLDRIIHYWIDQVHGRPLSPLLSADQVEEQEEPIVFPMHQQVAEEEIEFIPEDDDEDIEFIPWDDEMDEEDSEWEEYEDEYDT